MGHDPRETSAPLVDAWHRARARRMRPLQGPGHKGRFADGRDDLGSDNLPSDVFGSDLLGDLVRDDLPMQGGADDNAYTGGYLEQAEALWASAVGGDHARFLVGGSTQGRAHAARRLDRGRQRILAVSVHDRTRRIDRSHEGRGG